MVMCRILRAKRAGPGRSVAIILLSASCALLAGCVSGTKLSTDPIKWADPDHRSIAEPAEIRENQVWDIVNHTCFYELGKVLDLRWTGRRLGNVLQMAPRRQADNVNALGEVCNSSWFTNRHHLKRMTLEEIAVGPGIARPDTNGQWEIVRGKFEGGTAGFTIRDPRGDLYVLKFDSEGNNEMGSSAEVIATKLLHASGYNVPPNSVVYFNPSILKIGAKTTVPDGQGGKRPMLEADLQGILDNIIPQPSGQLRCVASKYLKGKPVGIFNYHGRRRDDPNDRVKHQHRRELRGLRVISSLMNDADRRAANTLDMYVEEDGRKYVKHYLIDMGSAFGSNNLMPHLPKYGNEYVWDPRTIGLSLASLGLYRKAWEDPLPMEYPSLGYFENETFRPNGWVPTYPNPAFQRCTPTDGYWGAKIVMSFTDGDIAAAVRTGRLSNPDAEAELIRLIAERRDIIGRYWFGRVNPLDRFRIEEIGMRFDDLAIEGGLASRSETTYHYRVIGESGAGILPKQTLRGSTVLPMPSSLPAGRYYGFEIRTARRGEPGLSKYTRVYFHKRDSRRYQVVKVEREE
jgi:hypothetical protein